MGGFKELQNLDKIYMVSKNKNATLPNFPVPHDEKAKDRFTFLDVKLTKRSNGTLKRSTHRGAA